MIQNIPITEIQTRPQQFTVHTTWNTHKSILQSFQPNNHLQFNVPNNRSNQPETKQPIFELLSVSIAQLVGQVLPVYLFHLLLSRFFPAVYFLSVNRKCWVLRKITKATPMTQKKMDQNDILSSKKRSLTLCKHVVSKSLSQGNAHITTLEIGSFWVILKQICHKNPFCFSLSNLTTFERDSQVW